jgi:hypothetical protein
MRNMTKDFITKIKKARSSKSAAKAVDQLLSAPSLDVVIKRLIATSREVDDNTLGYFVFPGLRKKAARDQALLSEIQKLVQRRGVPFNVRLHCIELIDKVFREQQTSYPSDYVDFIVETAANPAIPKMARAKIARLLTRVQGRKQLRALRALLESKSPQLVEAACHTISWWSKQKLRTHGKLVDQIIGFVERSPADAMKNSNVLRTLAQSNKRRSFIALNRVLAKAKKEADWSRLVAIVGPSCPPDQLAKITKGATAQMGPQATIAIRNLFKKQPSRLVLLYKKKYWKEFIDSMAAVPEAMGAAALSYIENIGPKADSRTLKKAVKLKHELTTAKQNAVLPKSQRLNLKVKSARLRTPLPNKQKINDEFSTGFHMGDALYRDTYLVDPFCHNHWHAGIFQTLEFQPKGTGIDGHMQGVHMSGFPGEVKPFTSKRWFGDPNCNVATEMQKLYKKFLKAFDVDSDHPYHGARRTPNMSKSDRLNLWSTSADLMNQGIQYTFADMLDWKGSDWNGSISDIDDLRCDGLVEYTYEKCGKKVCEGKKKSKWNIAAAGKAHPKSHDDLHTWSLNKGELCPKVQAGAAGNDTTFIEPQPSVPIVQKFAVYEEAALAGSDIQTKNVIAIKLNAQSNEYDIVYVRIVVGPSGGPFHFAVTGANGFPWSLAGQWAFKEVAEGTDHVAYWSGATSKSGTDYFGTNGNYEFRMVIVDRGGNVSEEYSCTIPIDWSQILPKPW